ncbi:alcohol dehydrogenase catalytic domain-containing protein [Sulfitobacter mediterraneus]|jgi:D-arabinose 1-dehydrogenase-like Zn-dependent alcohol dehydrogenase|uniref:zinc-binding dehydrogenase n=1 Tax=Sulfitobacter mediterraneus TaxID=83219 RepID=UPI0019331709|nr:alcohol dehydrogenase catalytic domain-containing protein [Sulfitobacter mediterraneus]MBM1632206.1 alcohol dehydrogenase catalytic domain-containing protein [Sulfitobacter mediterraneus]MBM1640022.1 alcohol dehydrogenase catalytic domain-containing protein [Sulfitobacter mediterraneus]MBM1644071.1 alcohol dehydrogenase catalytic domain-containing protein [Sulfitobacter mediterraneus]MBM1648117.1 alcohol dehydrogenase catalytic domain-containing protein [Sulfitobacter mediterraneus]MBM16521
MRAARLTAWRAPLEIADLPMPDAPDGGVVLRVLACGVCRSDWHVWTGADPDVSLPHVPGHEYCGEVIAVGAGVTRWRIGDRVIAPFILACGSCPDCAQGHQTICAQQALPGFTHAGAFAEAIAVPFADANLTALPEALDPALAAALGCRVTTAWHALTGRAAVQAGEWVAVFGTGGVGLSAALLARGLGARVIAVDVAQGKLDHAKALGADAVVNAAQCDPAEAIRELTGGGADVAIEALGVVQTTVPALKCLRKLGRMVQVGMPAGDHTTMPIPMDAVYSGQLAVFGTRGMPSWRYPPLIDFIMSGRVDLTPLVARRIGLSQATEELAVFDGPAPPGVAVITDFAG